jgi:endonuclease/exonuclease/phosphatase family metal-dependent hydrolase
MSRFALLLLVFCLAAVLYVACSGSAEVDRPVTATELGARCPEGAFDAAAFPPPTADGQVRLATLNAEFLFDGVDGDGRASFDWKDDARLAFEHMECVADVIAGLDADVVMLQEVENESVAQRLAAELLPQMGYRVYFEQGKDTFTGQDIALLARVPVSEIGRTDARAPVAGTESDTYGVSKNLWARAQVDGVETTLIGLHLLSRPDDADRKPSREAQAEVIRQLVEEETSAGRAVVVLGDFNDFDPMGDRDGSQPITDVLARIKSAGPAPSDDLVNVMQRADPSRRYTAFYDRNRNDAVDTDSRELSAIDHILLSPSLAERVVRVDFVHGYDPRRVTDHFPVVVTLE